MTRRQVGQVEVHRREGPVWHPIFDGDWGPHQVLRAYDLFEAEGGQFRVRVLRELPDDPGVWKCVASFLPE